MSGRFGLEQSRSNYAKATKPLVLLSAGISNGVHARLGFNRTHITQIIQEGALKWDGKTESDERPARVYRLAQVCRRHICTRYLKKIKGLCN